MYIYIQSEPKLWTVGHYAPDGKFIPQSDHGVEEDACNHVAFLNGGDPTLNMDMPYHGLRAGMMYVRDNDSTPTGLVIIRANERFVTVVNYTIRNTGVSKYKPSDVLATGLHVRTVGVDTLPAFNAWCDEDTTLAIVVWQAEMHIEPPKEWAEWAKRNNYGPTYPVRKFGILG